MARIRYEISSVGLDEALQGVSSDPFTTAGNSVWTGLRIPPVINVNSLPSTQPRYLFNLANVPFSNGIKILGLRQGYTLGIDANEGTLPERPIELFARTPTFRFPDGNISWHVLVDRQPQRKVSIPSTDTQNWAFKQADSPAMLYQSFTNSNVVAATGAPVFYMKGLTSYVPPDLTASVESVAGLGNIHDLRFPWDSDRAWSAFGHGGYEVTGKGRLCFYASVLQTNPNTRGAPTMTMTNLSSSGMPEEAFIQDYTAVVAEVGIGPIFWRIMGSLLVEFEK